MKPINVEVKLKGPNPYGIRDGELLPIVSGPHAGRACSIEVLPFIPGGGLPSAMLRVGAEWYELDAENRCWRHSPARPADRPTEGGE